jgi:flagellar basal body rod protein FlgG
MDNLTIAAASGLRSRMQSLDLLANNLANTATAGFKRDLEFYGTYSSSDSDDPINGGASSTLPTVEKQWTDFSQGTIQVTGNPLDVALDGNGFLAVTGPKNTTLYTRAGNLKVLASGALATSDSYPLQGVGGSTIQIAPNKPIVILPDGTVQQGGQAVGRLNVVSFPSTNPLQKMGSTCFENSDTKKNAPVAATNVTVEQGKIEGSNVPVADAAMRLVGVMRQFEMLQKAIGVSNDMDTKTISEVARVV